MIIAISFFYLLISLDCFFLGDLFIPSVQVLSIKKKKKNRLMPNSRPLSKRRACKGLLHVLFLNARLITEHKKPVKDETVIKWGIAIHRPSVKNDTTKKLKRIYKPDNLYPPILENRISGTSLEIFKHLELSNEESEQYYQFLKDYKPSSYKSYNILTETGRYYNNNQTVYEMKDRLLQEFINKCLIVFNSGVFLILRYYHKTDKFKKIKVKGTSQIVTKGEQINEYEKYMNIWFGSRKAYHSIDIFRGRFSLTNDDANKRLERAMIDIYKHSILDDELNNINKKYQIVEKKYPDTIDAILEILFPKFFRDVIREEYMKKTSLLKKEK